MKLSVTPKGSFLDGVLIEPDTINAICAKTKIPKALINVDEREGTDFFNTLLNTRTGYSTVVEDNKVVGFVKDDSTFLSKEDVKFSADLIAHKFGSEVLQRRNFLYVPISDSTNILGDLYRKEIILSRNVTGGLNVGLNILRLLCTNGSEVVERSVRKHLATGINQAQLDPLYDTFSSYSIKNLIMSAMLDSSGKMIEASVADVLKFSDMLTPYSDVTGVHAIADDVVSQYLANGVDTKKYSRRELENLPSGISYYKAYNILTADARSCDLSEQDRVTIGSYLHPKNQLVASSFKAPVFDDERISVLMGDKVLN